MKVTIYTMNQCTFCEAAKRLMKELGVTYTEIKLEDDDDAAWDALTAKSGLKTAPQIFADDKLIGGFDALSVLDKKDKLLSLL